MTPKKKSPNRWFADHKASWITGLCVIIAATIGIFKYSGASGQYVNEAGTNVSHMITQSGSQTGNNLVADHATIAQQMISAGSNQAPIYAPQNITYNNYYAPNSNSVTKEAIEALESRLATATNKIGSSGMFWEFFIGRDKGLIPRSGRRYRF